MTQHDLTRKPDNGHIGAWTTVAHLLEAALDCHVYGFDPGFACFYYIYPEEKKGEVYFNIPADIAIRIVNLHEAYQLT